MTDSDPGAADITTTDDWPAYLRRVSFLDKGTPAERGEKNLGALIHVAQQIQLDDELISPYTIDLNEGWAVSSTGAAETIVSFSVRAEHITPAVLDAQGDWVAPAQICGRPVEVPPGQPWEEYDRVTLMTGGYRRSPARMVRVFIRVPEVVIGDVPAKAGDRVTDGGIVGELVKCEQCSGDGLLHQPDPDQISPAQEPSA